MWVSVVLVLVAVVAGHYLSRLARVPSFVTYLALGILLGPGMLDAVHVAGVLGYAGSIGGFAAFALGGWLTDPRVVPLRDIGMGTLAWIGSVILGGALWYAYSGSLRGAAFVGIALSATAAATLVIPALATGGLMDTVPGRKAVASALPGQFLPLVAVAVLGGGFPYLALAYLAGIGARWVADHVAIPAVIRRTARVLVGVLVPVFFVHTGLVFDLPGLRQRPIAFAYIPLFAVMLLVAHGGPSWLSLPRRTSLMDVCTVTLMSSTVLAATIVLARQAVSAGALSSVQGAALKGAAMLSALVFPILALACARHGALRMDRSQTGQPSA